ncbi:hypothetical protein Vafri_16630 [Volvox africanus]|uniref:Uncharacterized protein n=1 Tax=Volvox africanus TaxID=51714 RepID=A0A8J4BIT4_9CHLO|nr:hypothetical protein Vafri_16630 [Volvox africanus]
MNCRGSAQASEHELRRVMTSLAETDPAYAATLSDLAVMKLNQQLEQASSSVAPNDEGQTSNDRTDRSRAAASPLPPPPQPGPRTRSKTRSTIPVSVATNPSPSSLPKPKLSASSPSLPGNSSTNTSSSGSSNPRAQQDPSSARPRVCSGSSASAMAVGAAMFARALGNRPVSARPKTRSSGSEPGIEAPALPVSDATPASTIAAPNKVDTEITGRGTSAGPSSRSSPRPGSPTSAAAVTAAQEQEKGGIAGRREPAGLASARVPAADTERAGMTEFRGGGGDGESASRAAAGTAVASYSGDMEGLRRRMSSGTGEVRQSSLPPAEMLGAAGYATTLAAEPKLAATAAAGTPDGAAWKSSGGGNTEDSYLPAAAAAVAAMTAKPTGWGPGCGAAAGARPEGRSGGGCGAGGGGGGGSSSVSGGGGRVVVKEFYLESRGQNGGEADPEAAAADAALRASLGECRHVLEVYGLTTEVRTSHLQDFVSELASQDGRPLPVIKWVDDHHALLVCPDGATALYLLQVDQDLFQLRPFAEASPASQAVAATDLLPPRDRPKTTAAVAKKLLSHALGMSQLRDRDGEKDLAEQRKAAREARLERERKLAAAWDDD